MSRYSLNTHIQALLQHLPMIASVCSILLSCLTLLGWLFDLPLLASLLPGGHRMSPLGMLGFLFAGASLALLQSDLLPKNLRHLARAGGLLVLLIGLFALVDILSTRTPGIEQSFFAAVFSYADARAIKALSPQTALSFLFLGVALLLLDVGALRARMQVYLCSCVVLLISALALLGYGFGARGLYEMTPERGIAVNSALALILLSLGILSSRLDVGLTSILTSQNVSGQVARRLLVAAVTVPLLLALVAIIGERIGRYDSAFGAALLIILNITIFIALIWRSAELLHKVETERQQSAAALHLAYQNLEQRVAERTAELAVANDELRREIGERQKMEEERARLLASEQAAREQAEKDSRLKDEFLNTVSHELRAPLNTVRGWVSLLRAGTLDEGERGRALERIESGGRELEQKVGDLLDVSRLVNGRLHLQIRPVELVPVVEAAVGATRAAAAAKDIDLQTYLEAAPDAVLGDANRLQQVVWNLVSNAIKFTPKGGRVTVSLRPDEEHVEVVVRDSGVGISADVLPFIFDHFRQADGSRTRRQRGLGVGLTIVRQLVEMHGGTVRIESGGEGRGTTSVIRLPVMKDRLSRPPTAPQLSHSEPSPALSCPANIKARRLLVVDDDGNSRQLVADTLSACNAVVRTATSIDAALLVLTAWTPDLVILNMDLHREGGELTERLQELENASGVKIPVVALTGPARLADRLRALRSGFTMHVPRPVEPAELLTVVSSLAGRLADKLCL